MHENRWLGLKDGKVTGVQCTICGSRKVTFPVSVPVAEATCPQCGRAICTECATLGEPAPVTAADVARYIKSCDDGHGIAFCGQCGNYGRDYLDRYLKMVGVTVPTKHKKHTKPTSFNMVLQYRVAALAEHLELSNEAADAFMAGARGIIKLKHATGEIWGIPEKHGSEWCITLCYPEDR